jgi:hypothetical protein
MMAANQMGDGAMKRDEIITISNGNREMGNVMNISTVPVQCCPDGVPCATGGCYVLKPYRLHPDKYKLSGYGQQPRDISGKNARRSTLTATPRCLLVESSTTRATRPWQQTHCFSPPVTSDGNIITNSIGEPCTILKSQ